MGAQLDICAMVAASGESRWRRLAVCCIAEWYSARDAFMMRLDSPKLADFQSAKQQSSTLRYGAGARLRPCHGAKAEFAGVPGSFCRIQTGRRCRSAHYRSRASSAGPEIRKFVE